MMIMMTTQTINPKVIVSMGINITFTGNKKSAWHQDGCDEGVGVGKRENVFEAGGRREEN